MKAIIKIVFEIEELLPSADLEYICGGLVDRALSGLGSDRKARVVTVKALSTQEHDFTNSLSVASGPKESGASYQDVSGDFQNLGSVASGAKESGA